MSIRIPIISEFDSKGIDKAVKDFKSLEGVGAKSQYALQKAALPAAAALGAVAAAATFAVKAAIEDAAAQDQLAGVLRRSAMATDEAIAANEKFITTLSQATATADDQLRPALASLVTATGSLELSQSLLIQAQDIAASTGADLATVTDALSKAYNGNMKGLKALDPSLMAAIKSGESFDSVMAMLADTTGGAATDAANTAAGKMKGLSIAFDETKESIGAALMPALEGLLPILQKVAVFAQENTKLFLIVGGVIGGVAGTILILNAAMKVYRATQLIANIATGAFNAILLLNPIGLVILGIAAFIAIMTALYFKFDIVRKIVDIVFQGMLAGGKAVFDGLTTYFTGVFNIYKALFNGIAKLWNNTIGKLSFKIPSWVPGLGGNGFSVPNIPMLADGGIVTGPTLAMIGERGPEAVIPLNRAGGMGTTINVNGVITEQGAGQAIVNALKRYNQTTGPISIAVA